jgi:long-chain fatty acid transport protein
MNPGRKEKDMKKCCFAGWIAVLSVFLLPLAAFAGGFGLNEQGAKATGMANAFAAQADDPSAVYFNPAGIVQLEGTQVSIGTSFVMPRAKFQSSTPAASDPLGFRGTSEGDTTNMDDKVAIVPNAYLTQKISDRLSFGFGTFSNFGLETNWPNDWEGRFMVGGTKAELITLSVNPVLAFKPHERISLAVGPVMQYLDFDLRRKTFTGGLAGEPESKFSGDDVDWGWNAALMVWLTDNLKFGASYRSEVGHSINGKLDFNPQVPGANLTNTTLHSSISTPANAYLGLAWTHGPLTLEFDAQWTDWSSWNELKAKFNKAVGPGVTELVVDEDWHDAWGYRFGAQFAVNQYLDVRAGIAYDESPIPNKSVSCRIPGGDRWIYAVGFGGHYEAFTADLAYQYVDAESTKLGNEGQDPVYDAGAAGPLTGKFKDVDAHIVAVNLTYKF